MLKSYGLAFVRRMPRSSEGMAYADHISSILCLVSAIVSIQGRAHPSATDCQNVHSSIIFQDSEHPFSSILLSIVIERFEQLAPPSSSECIVSRDVAHLIVIFSLRSVSAFLQA